MARTYAYSADFDKEVENLFREAEFLGEGHNGIVYEVPGNKALKIFLEKKICKEEADILERVRKSKYFPKIYKRGDYYILREKVGGTRLDHYIEQYGLTEKLSYNLYKLLREFEELKFTKLDIRCRDVYVEEDERVMVIDPKQCYKRKVSYPRHLMKGLNGINVLDQFLNYVERFDKKTSLEWGKKMEQYYYKQDNEEIV